MQKGVVAGVADPDRAILRDSDAAYDTQRGTVVIIAHRMRTVAGADKAVYIKEGRVERIGKPSDFAYADAI